MDQVTIDKLRELAAQEAAIRADIDRELAARDAAPPDSVAHVEAQARAVLLYKQLLPIARAQANLIKI